MAFKEVNNNTYNVELDEEHQDEIVRRYRETCDHADKATDDMAKFNKGLELGLLGAAAIWIFKDPIVDGVKFVHHKTTDFVRTKVFHKEAKYDTKVDKDGNVVVDAKVTDVEES